MKLNLKWFKGDTTEEEKKETRELLLLSKPVLDKLRDLCYNSVNSFDKSRLAKPDYNSPSWPIVQADANGYMRAMKEIIEMIDEIEE